MHKPNENNFSEMEKSLSRLMPVAISDGAQERMEEMLDGLAGDSRTARFDFRKSARWLGVGGLAAALGLSAYLFIPYQNGLAKSTDAAAAGLPPELVYLSESDRVEGVSDEGLFVDSGGSAVRKVRVRMVEESRIRDEETGIIVMLTEPREEMYSVPVSTF